MNLIVFAEQQFGQIGTILTRDSGDQCALGHGASLQNAEVNFSVIL
jgi:hypothetical protein